MIVKFGLTSKPFCTFSIFNPRISPNNLRFAFPFYDREVFITYIGSCVVRYKSAVNTFIVNIFGDFVVG